MAGAKACEDGGESESGALEEDARGATEGKALEGTAPGLVRLSQGAEEERGLVEGAGLEQALAHLLHTRPRESNVSRVYVGGWVGAVVYVGGWGWGGGG